MAGKDAVGYEKQLLGQVLRDPRIFSSLRVDDRHFSSLNTKRLYAAMKRCTEYGLDITLSTIFDFDDQIPAAWLSELDTNTPTSANWEWTEGHVVRAYKHRVLRNHATYLSGEWTLGDAITETERILDMLTAESLVDSMSHRKELFVQWRKELRERAVTHELPGLPTGIQGLDDKILGWQPGMLYVIAARPSQGKTALGVYFLDSLTVGRRVPAGWVDVENSYRQIITRSVSRDTGISGTILRRAEIKKQEEAKIDEAGEKFSMAPCWLYCSPNQRVERVASVIRAMVRQHGVKVVFVDYLQKIAAPGKERMDRVAAASTTLKALATQLDIPIIALAQLSREAEHTRPRLNMLQWASQIEQDADGILFLYPREGSTIEVIVAKDREGETGSVYVSFDRERMKFTEIEK